MAAEKMFVSPGALILGLIFEVLVLSFTHSSTLHIPPISYPHTLPTDLHTSVV